jgi:hypothetical protein
VATEVAGIPEIVADGETGWLVPAGNSLALATALVDVFADRARATKIGRAARDVVLPRFGIDGYVTSVVGLYDELVRLKPDATKLKPDVTKLKPDVTKPKPDNKAVDTTVHPN